MAFRSIKCKIKAIKRTVIWGSMDLGMAKNQGFQTRFLKK